MICRWDDIRLIRTDLVSARVGVRTGLEPLAVGRDGARKTAGMAGGMRKMKDRVWRRLLQIETLVVLLLARLALRLVPFRSISRMLGPVTAADTLVPPPPKPRDMIRARATAWRVAGIANALPWHSTCLVRALALVVLLRRRRISGACIRFGVTYKDGALTAHAWVLLDREVLIGGGSAMQDHVPLADLMSART